MAMTFASKAASLGFVDHMVQTDAVRLHYVTAGRGEPAVNVP